MGRPKNEDYGTVTQAPDGSFIISSPGIDEAPDDIFPDYYYWVAGPPLLTDDPDPENLKNLPQFLAEFSWGLIKEDYIKPKLQRLKQADVLLLLYEHPGSTYQELLAHAEGQSPTGLYAQITSLVKCGMVIKQYKLDYIGSATNTKIYSVATPPKLPPKFSWRIHSPQIIICGHEQPKTARLRRLHLLLAPLGWNVQQRKVGRTYISWNKRRLTDDEIISCINDEPGAALDRLVELYRPTPTTVWSQGELDHATACMKTNLYRLRVNDKIKEKNGAYYIKPL